MGSPELLSWSQGPHSSCIYTFHHVIQTQTWLFHSVLALTGGRMAHQGSQETRPLPEPALAVSAATAAQGGGGPDELHIHCLFLCLPQLLRGTGLFSQSEKEEAGRSVLPALSRAEEAGIHACFLHLEPVKAQGSSLAVVSGHGPG